MHKTQSKHANLLLDVSRRFVDICYDSYNIIIVYRMFFFLSVCSSALSDRHDSRGRGVALSDNPGDLNLGQRQRNRHETTMPPILHGDLPSQGSLLR